MKLNWVYKGTSGDATICFAQLERFTFYVQELSTGQFRLEVLYHPVIWEWGIRAWKDIPTFSVKWAQARTGYFLKKVLRREPGL